MQLSDLDKESSLYKVILLETPSVKLQQYIQDKVKRHLGSRAETVMDITNKSELKNVKDIIHINPPISRAWFVSVNLHSFNDSDLFKIITDSTSCVFFLTCEKYSEFKKAKEALKKCDGVMDFYITYLRRNDLIYLYDAFIPESKRLSGVLFNYVAQSYSGDIDTLFDIMLSILDGDVYNNRTDLTNRFGIGNLSVDSVVFQLLAPLGTTKRGIAKTMGNRVKAIRELGDSIGFGTMYNFMNTCLKAMIELKTLIISGKVYKSLNNIPEGYDEKALSRYQKHIWRLRDIPLSSLLAIRQAMGNQRWTSELDAIGFVYRYYNYRLQLEKVKEIV